MSKERTKVPKRGVEAERRRSKAIARENELLVKRLLSVKTSFDRKGDEKDFQRHQRDKERMGKVRGPPPPYRPSRQLPWPADAAPAAAPLGPPLGASAASSALGRS